MLGLSRLASTLFALAFLVFAWMTYDNVWTPIEPIQEVAESAACIMKNCKQRHGVTKIDRLPNGQTFEYTWQSGTVIVKCHRRAYLFGPVECAPQP
jgi:hypothetical protein